MMKARKLIGDMALGREALKVLEPAFDEAWLEIAGNFGSDTQEIEAARLSCPRHSFLLPVGALNLKGGAT